MLLDPIIVLDRLLEMRDRIIRAPEPRLHARNIEEDERLRPLFQHRLERLESAIATPTEATIDTHNRLQYYSFDSNNLLVQHDYDADVLGGAPASNQAAAYREFRGLLFPTRRRVTSRGADGAAGIGPILVSIDFGQITVR